MQCVYICSALHRYYSLYRSANECVLVHAVQWFVEGLLYPIYNVEEFRKVRNDGKFHRVFYDQLVAQDE